MLEENGDFALITSLVGVPRRRFPARTEGSEESDRIVARILSQDACGRTSSDGLIFENVLFRNSFSGLSFGPRG